MEVFGPGTTSGIKIINIIEGTSRSFEYYPQARIDGLQTREEVNIIHSQTSKFFGIFLF